MSNFKNIWFVNIGEPLPIEGNRPHRMSNWKLQLEERGFSVIFFTTDFEHQRKKRIINSPFGYYLLKSYIPYKKNVSIARLINHFLLSISLYRAFSYQKKNPDVILVSYPTIGLSLVSILYGKLNNIKVVVDVRDKWPDIFITNNLLTPFIWPLFILKRYVFRNAKNILAISPGYYQWAKPSTEPDDLFILPLSYPSMPKVKRFISSFLPIKFIFVGSLGMTYNLDILIHMHDLLEKEKIPFLIQICGDGPRKEWLEKKCIGKDRIQILGWLNKSDLQFKLNCAHFGLMLYNEDAPQGWPNKLFEYMANGLPILNTLKGESWNLVQTKNLGINLNTNELNRLVFWLRELVNDNYLYEFYVNQNYATHKKYFSDEENIEKLIKVLK